MEAKIIYVKADGSGMATCYACGKNFIIDGTERQVCANRECEMSNGIEIDKVDYNKRYLKAAEIKLKDVEGISPKDIPLGVDKYHFTRVRNEILSTLPKTIRALRKELKSRYA